MFSVAQLQLLPPKLWSDFEDLCHEIVRVEWNDFFAQKNGRSGHGQNGVDIFGQRGQRGGQLGVQCKKFELRLHPKLRENQLNAAVREAKRFRPPLRELLLATTLPRDPKLQQLAREISAAHSRKQLFSVRVLSWDDIVEMLARHPQVAHRYYPFLPQAPQVGAHNGPVLRKSTESNGRQLAQSGRKRLARPIILSASTLQSLGLIATSPFRPTLAGLERLVPNVAWRAEIKRLLSTGAVTCSKGGLSVPRQIATAMLRSVEDKTKLLETWVEILTPLREHVDTALFLGLQFVRLKRFPEAVSVLVDVAADLEPGSWNDTYRDILPTLNSKTIVSALSSHELVRYHNSVGLCLSRSGDGLMALPWFRRLRKLSLRTRNVWGLGQSYLNEGVMLLKTRDRVKGLSLLEKAVKHGRKYRDWDLFGVALCNLALAIAEDDPGTAAESLDKCLQEQRRTRDGRIPTAIYHCRGLIASGQGDYHSALQWFRRAEREAQSRDQREAIAIARCNQAAALVDSGRSKDALPLYASARQICEEDELSELTVQVLRAESYALQDVGQHAKAEAVYRRLQKLFVRSDNHAEIPMAMHDIALLQFRQKKATWRKTFRQALQLSRVQGDEEGIYRCRSDAALINLDQVGLQRALEALHSAANDERSRKNDRVAARLFDDILRTSLEHNAPEGDIERAFATALKSWKRVPQAESEVCRTYELQYGWHWSLNRHSAALEALRNLEDYAATCKLREQRCRALGQRGMCLQELGDLPRAGKAHQAALRLARHVDNHTLMESALNNYGEYLRATGQAGEAIPLLKQAEAICRKLADWDSAVTSKHNRALAMFDRGQRAAAGRLMRECENESKARKLSERQVQAQHGLAHFASQTKRLQEAKRLYRRALHGARRHEMTDARWQIAFNFGNLLYSLKSPKRALALYKEALAHCDWLNRALCHQQVALCHSEAGHPEQAVLHHLHSREAAVAAGDRPTASQASESLADVYETVGRYDASNEALQGAIALADDPERKLTLECQRLAVLLKLKKESAAKRLFEKLRVAMRADPAVQDLLVDIHMMIGDYNWQEGARAEALKIYTVAMTEAIKIDSDNFMEVGGHVLHQLRMIPREERLADLKKLGAALREWLAQQFQNHVPATTSRLLFWPFAVTRKMTECPADGNRLSNFAVGKLIQEAITQCKKT